MGPICIAYLLKWFIEESRCTYPKLQDMVCCCWLLVGLDAVALGFQLNARHAL